MKREEFMQAVKELIGDRNDDTVLSILQYLKDNEQPQDNTKELEELRAKVTELETAKTDLDNEWRNKYKEAFFSSPIQNNQTPEQQQQYGKEPEQDNLEFENLFSEITDNK